MNATGDSLESHIIAHVSEATRDSSDAARVDAGLFRRGAQMVNPQ
jgi:hypothetical protein